MILLALAALAAQQQPVTPPTVLTRPLPGAEPIPLMIAEPVAMAIAAFDADSDAVVTRAEFDAGVRKSFEAVAKGQSSIGYINFGDWSERWLGNRNALPSPFEVDQDGDNRISLAELQGRFELFFTRFDRDKNGAIARSELLTTRPQPQPGARPADGENRRPQRRRG